MFKKVVLLILLFKINGNFFYFFFFKKLQTLDNKILRTLKPYILGLNVLIFVLS